MIFKILKMRNELKQITELAGGFGLSSSVIQKLTGLSRQRIYFLRFHDKRGWKIEDTPRYHRGAAFLDMYTQGFSVHHISEHFSVARQTVDLTIKMHQMLLRRLAEDSNE